MVAPNVRFIRTECIDKENTNKRNVSICTANLVNSERAPNADYSWTKIVP